VTETAVAHRCPRGKQTMRAERLALLTSPGYDKRETERGKQQVADQIAADRAVMAEKQLCEKCGYPLDNSDPK
jgi:hypothetical protein